MRTQYGLYFGDYYLIKIDSDHDIIIIWQGPDKEEAKKRMAKYPQKLFGDGQALVVVDVSELEDWRKLCRKHQMEDAKKRQEKK